jgi:uncharacterized protein YndB with AHSA1/START domain
MITVSTNIIANIEKVWEYFTNPTHIVNWYFAHPSWHCPKASNNVTLNGTFNFRMEARDESEGFDFEGIYSLVEMHKRINYGLADGRQVHISFTQKGNEVTVTESFDSENENTIELQQGGWQAILDNFKSYVEQL